MKISDIEKILCEMDNTKLTDIKTLGDLNYLLHKRDSYSNFLVTKDKIRVKKLRYTKYGYDRVIGGKYGGLIGKRNLNTKIKYFFEQTINEIKYLITGKR